MAAVLRHASEVVRPAPVVCAPTRRLRHRLEVAAVRVRPAAVDPLLRLRPRGLPREANAGRCMVLLPVLLVLLVHRGLTALHVVQRGLLNALAPQLVSLVALGVAEQHVDCGRCKQEVSAPRSKV